MKNGLPSVRSMISCFSGAISGASLSNALSISSAASLPSGSSLQLRIVSLATPTDVSTRGGS